MSPGFHVSCDDRSVASWLADWLAATRLIPPVPLELAVRVAERLNAAEPDARAPFRQPLLEIRSGPPGQDVRIRWLPAPARAVVAAGARRADVEVSAEALGDRELLARSFFMTVVIFLLRRAGWHHVHAATAVDPDGRGWLFAGNAQSGKSTTAALLASWGWSVGADDAAFVTRAGSGVEVVAERAAIGLRPGGFRLLGIAGGMDAGGGRKVEFFPEDLGGTWVQRVVPEILILPRVGDEAAHGEALRPREALAELVRWSGWVALEPALAQEHLDLLGALARQVRSYRVTLGRDLFRRRDFFRELIA
jgi:hypothetical protein